MIGIEYRSDVDRIVLVSAAVFGQAGSLFASAFCHNFYCVGKVSKLYVHSYTTYTTLHTLHTLHTLLYITLLYIHYSTLYYTPYTGTAKAAVQSLMAFYIWGNEATIAGIAGIFLVIFGSGLYTWVQMNASKPIPKTVAEK